MTNTMWFENGAALAGGTSADDNEPRRITPMVKTVKPFFLRRFSRPTNSDRPIVSLVNALNWASKICLEHCYRVTFESEPIILVIVNCRFGDN